MTKRSLTVRRAFWIKRTAILGLVGAFLFMPLSPFAAYGQESAPATPPAGQEKAATVETDQPAADEESGNRSPSTGAPAEASIEKVGRRLGRSRNASRYSQSFISLFEPLTASVAPSTVQIFVNNRQIMLGTVVDSTGLILTKASELKSPLECRFGDGAKANASVLGIDTETDLALLQVTTTHPLTSIQLALTPSPIMGSWLATVVPETKPLALGVVGVNERIIGAARAYIGIFPVDRTEGDGVRINEITAGSPADAADLRINDVIVKIDDKDTKTASELRKVLSDYAPGDRVKLTILRGDETLVIDIELANMENIDPEFERSNQQNRMGSTLSRRRQDFPMAFQHDSGIQANQCGSPLVNSHGQVVGINIARSGRVSTLALPMQIVLPALERLRTGQLAPAIIYKTRLEEIQKELETISVSLNDLPKILVETEDKLKTENARKAEVEKLANELKQRLDEINKSTESLELEAKNAKDQLKAAQNKQQKLLDEQRDLSFSEAK